MDLNLHLISICATEKATALTGFNDLIFRTDNRTAKIKLARTISTIVNEVGAKLCFH